MPAKSLQSCPTLYDPMVPWGPHPLGDLPDPGMEPQSLMSPALAGRFFTTTATGEDLTQSLAHYKVSTWSERRSIVSDSLRPHGLYSPWNSSGQNTGMGRHFLLQGIFLTQGSNPGLSHYRHISYQLSHQGSPTSVNKCCLLLQYRLYLPVLREIIESLKRVLFQQAQKQICQTWGDCFPDSSVGKESACNVGDLGSNPGLGRSPGEGKGYPLQYSGLENTKSQTRLSAFHFQ